VKAVVRNVRHGDHHVAEVGVVIGLDEGLARRVVPVQRHGGVVKGKAEDVRGPFQEPRQIHERCARTSIERGKGGSLTGEHPMSPANNDAYSQRGEERIFIEGVKGTLVVK
jgi:hypothetical protein